MQIICTISITSPANSTVRTCRCAALRRRVGTPFYLYSTATLEHHFKVFEASFHSFPHLVCFTVKANANPAILRLFAQLGAGADIVSGGELHRALRPGWTRGGSSTPGWARRPDEIRAALKAGILSFNLESSQEMEEINRIAGRLR